MKKLLSISATALLTIFSCQNDSELENNNVPEQNLSNPKTSSNANAFVAPAKLLAEDNFNSLSVINWTTIVGNKTLAGTMDPAIKVWKNVAANAYIINPSGTNGLLVLRSEKTDSITLQTARLESNNKTFDRKFGYVEARMYICNPATTNVQSAFWFYSDEQTSATGGTDGAEVDIFESTNGLDRYPSTIHIDDNFSKKHLPYTYDAPGSTTGYHTYAMEWFSGYITIYYDRKPVRTFINGELFRGTAYNWIPNVNEFAILSVAPAWGNAAIGFANRAVGDKTYTYVDYVRWYDKKPF